MDWKRFFSEPGTVLTSISSGILGFTVGVANGVIQKQHGGWSAFFRAIATGTMISIIVGLGISDYVHAEPLRYAIIGFCAVVSDDIWAGFQTIGQGLRTDPLGYLVRIIDALRGRAPPPASTSSPDPKE